MNIYIKHFNAEITERGDQLFCGEKPLDDFTNEELTQFTLGEQQAIWNRYKYDIWGDPDFDFHLQQMAKLPIVTG